MAWGILEDRLTPQPPGTAPLHSKADSTALDSIETQHLKKKGDIILQPQPTDSPNDPLNWPYKRKITLFLILIISAIAVSGVSGMLSTGYQRLAMQYHTDFQTVVKILTPPAIVAVVIGLFIGCAIAAVWGKRVQFVVGSIFIATACFIGYFANSLQCYQGVYFVIGFAGAPLELLAAPIVTDMIFVHERGALTAIASLVGVVGADLSHIISGNIIGHLGIKYTFIISFGVWVGIAVLTYLFVYETTFDRSAYRAKESVKLKEAYEHDEVDEPAESKEPELTAEGLEAGRPTAITALPEYAEKKRSHRELLKVFRGRLTDRSFFKALVAPFPLILFPSVVFSTVVNGAFSTWVTVLSTINLGVLSAPPYSLPPDQLAYITLPGSAIGLITSVIAGVSSDWLIKYLSRRNNGTYEPEYRLLLMLPAVIFSTIGFYLLGHAFARGASVYELVGLGLFINAASPFASIAAFAYIFDTLGKNSIEAFVATSIFKALFSFVALQIVPTLFVRAGPVTVFSWLAVLNIIFSVPTIPMYVFGKRMRGAVSRTPWLNKFTVVE